nr:MAG TPA: hypothetical protein [Caudoviricetes sp.]
MKFSTSLLPLLRRLRRLRALMVSVFLSLSGRLSRVVGAAVAMCVRSV